MKANNIFYYNVPEKNVNFMSSSLENLAGLNCFDLSVTKKSVKLNKIFV